MSLTVHELDVRMLIAIGQPPIDAILRSVDALPAGASLRLHVPFEPKPLYAKLAGQGFAHTTTPQPDGSFLVLFAPRTIHLDLRLLEPPEPLQHTIEAVTMLAPRALLITLTRFRPVHLLAMLEERGFATTSTELPEGSWENVIFHPTARPSATANSGASTP